MRVYGIWYMVYGLFPIFFLIPCFLFLLPSPVRAADSVTAPSVDSNYSVADTTTRALLPQELYTTPAPQPIQIGVAKSFFDTITGLFCWLNSNFCPKNLDLSSGKTQDFVDKSTVLIQSERPSEIQPSHLKQDSRLQDNSNERATGNEKINSIQTSLGSEQGFYSNSLPDFDQLKITDPKNPPDLYKQVKISDNLKLGNKTFDEDLRVPDINIRQDIYYQANYPEGVEPFK